MRSLGPVDGSRKRTCSSGRTSSGTSTSGAQTGWTCRITDGDTTPGAPRHSWLATMRESIPLGPLTDLHDRWHTNTPCTSNKPSSWQRPSDYYAPLRRRVSQQPSTYRDAFPSMNRSNCRACSYPPWIRKFVTCRRHNVTPLLHRVQIQHHRRNWCTGPACAASSHRQAHRPHHTAHLTGKL